MLRIRLLLPFLFFAAAAHAESPEPPDPNYPALRYNDDNSQSQTAPGPDFFAQTKHVTLGEGSYFSLGGEIRERFESYRHPNFGLSGAPAKNAYELQRLLLNVDVHLTQYFRAFVQLGSMERAGGRGVSSTTDIDSADVMQAFVEFHTPPNAPASFTLRVGREELLLGWQRLIAVREGPNVRRAFDGARASVEIGGASLDAFAVRPVVDNTGDFDDKANIQQALVGLYGTLPLGGFGKLDAYDLGFDNDSAKFRGLTGQEKRQTLGARWFGKAYGFDWNLEGAYQTGTFRNVDVRAYLLAGVVGYTFANAPWTPRLSVEANYASGDNRHSATLGTFNPMFPRLPYFGELPLLSPANIKDIRPVLTLDPARDVQAVLATDWLWRASTTDGLYGSGMSLFAGTNGAKVTGAYIGQEISADLRWRLSPHLAVGGIVSEMFVGPALREALGKDVTYAVLYARYKF